VGVGFLVMVSLVFAWSSTDMHRSGARVPLSESGRVQPGRGRNLKRGSESVALRGGGSEEEVPHAQQRQSGLAKSHLDVVVEVRSLNPKPSTLNPNLPPSTFNPQPSYIKPLTSTLNPQPPTLSLKTLIPDPSSLNS